MNLDNLKKLVDEAGERTQTRVGIDAEIQKLLKERNKFVKRANEIGQAIQSRQNNIFIEELAKALEAVANEKGHSPSK
jgi:chorismate mutase